MTRQEYTKAIEQQAYDLEVDNEKLKAQLNLAKLEIKKARFYIEQFYSDHPREVKEVEDGLKIIRR